MGLLVVLGSCSGEAGVAPEQEPGPISTCMDRCVGERVDDCVLNAGACERICREGEFPRVRAARPTLQADEAGNESTGPAILSKTLGIETLGGVATPLIERCALLPAEIQETFSTAEDNQPKVEIHLVSGEASLARENRTLGRFHLEGIPPAPRGVPVIEVTMAIDVGGVLRVSARDRATGIRQEVTVVAPADAP